MTQSIYEREITAVLPRVLALFETDPCSPSFGLGDRLYWAWKLIDYPNATPQGVVHGLAVLVASGRLPWQIDPHAIVGRIDTAIRACGRITAKDGSVVESFPNEKSFCVTALIAFDILCAVDLLRLIVEPARIDGWLGIVEPMIGFILKNDETHATISNHLATAAAALFRWSENGNLKALERARTLMARLLARQSSEGWFSEYDGFDPGYETLALYYLADIHCRRPDEGLKPALMRSLDFLSYAAHPDDSFGGLYGSRNTRFIVPGGLEMLAGEIPAAAALSRFARRAIENRTVPTLATMDDQNLSPMFNSYCRALCAGTTLPDSVVAALPFEGKNVWRHTFPDAGLVLDKGTRHYTIVSTKKGGVVYHFRGSDALLDAGSAATKDDVLYTTQTLSPDNAVAMSGDKLVITARFMRAVSERLTPAKMIVLRILCLTAFRSRRLAEFVKRRLVRRLITPHRLEGTANRRTITLGYDLSIDDEFTTRTRLQHIRNPGLFRAIHMASSGYWQIGDDRP